jgi:transcriptional regulator with XRE-family HTH domain
MKIQLQLGMRIKYLRKKRNWSQEDLALEANINTKYLSDLENGRRNPSLLILERIAIALNISISELTKGLKSF